MHLAYDAKRLFCNHAGLGNYSRNLVGAVRKACSECSIALFTPRIPKSPEVVPFLGEEFETIAPRKWPKPLHAVWRSTYPGIVAAKLGCEIYHGLSSELPLLLHAGLKSVVTIHDLIFMKHPDYYPPTDRWIYQMKTLHATKKADRIVCISQSTANDLLDCFDVDQEKIRIIPPPVDIRYFETGDATDLIAFLQEKQINKPYILCVGTIEPRKDQGTVIEAFLRSGLHQSHELILAGKMTPYARKNLPGKLDDATDGGIRIVENLSNDEIRWLTRGAQLSIYASRYEGFGMPIAESLAAGTPVLAANSSSLPEAGGDGAVYFEPGNVEELAQLLQKTLTDRDELTAMAQRGKKYAQAFHPEVIAKKHLDLYKELI
ncbi:MAG: glycosyltransferase family 1 protein [Salibacteraceae bacterium]